MKQIIEKETTNDFTSQTTYTVKGREFLVEPIYNDEACESMGEILLKLMTSQSAEQIDNRQY